MHTGLTLELDALDALDIPRSAGIFGFPFTADTPLAAKFPLARLASLVLDACELVRCRLLLRCAAAKPYTPSSSSESVKSDSVRHGGGRGAYEHERDTGGEERHEPSSPMKRPQSEEEAPRCLNLGRAG